MAAFVTKLSYWTATDAGQANGYAFREVNVKSATNGLWSLVLATAMTPLCAAHLWAGEPILVTTGKDSGEGSLRAALKTLSGDEAGGQILVTTDDNIEIDTTLDYAGKGALRLHGNGQTVMSKADITLFIASQGADLKVSDLNFAGPGNFSIAKQGGTAKGIFVDVREDQSGVLTLELDDVKVSGLSYHGVHISDCDLADECGAGHGGAGGGSDTSIVVRLNDVEITDVGNGHFDADGFRVDERGPGDILFYANESEFTKTGADGVELDEGGAGSVFASAVDAKFDNNGAYCDPKLLKAFLPKEKKRKFEDGAMKEADVPPSMSGSPDDGCLERKIKLYESGSVKEYKFSIDTDDGFDIDEAGPGDLWALIVETSVKGNLDEGLDFGEEDAGDLKLTVWRAAIEGNSDDGMKIVESGAGNLTGLLAKVISKKNGGKGATFEQSDEGDIIVTVDQSATADNDDGKKSGLEVLQVGSGEGTLRVRASVIKGGIDVKNVNVLIK